MIKIRELFRHRLFGSTSKSRSALPDKPSQLILVALADLRAVENSPAYNVDMDLWHCAAIDETDTCSVCLAGAVMAQSLKIPIDETAQPYDLEGDEIEGKLLALNKFRQGRLKSGLELMEIEAPEGFKKNWHVVEYSTDREAFHEDMAIIAHYLDSVGL